MKKKRLIEINLRRVFQCVAMTFLTSFGAVANVTQKVEQVSGNVSLTTDVDYVITGADPFADGAVLDIVNTQNAVVIFENVKPSAASSHLGHLRINGAKAVKNSNCMVKIYANGCIILPHGSAIKPLTVYSGKDQTGESAQFEVSTHQSLEKHALNNKIQSFTLKRGYMVWFGTRSSTKDPGYNRIFIADKADIIVNLPGILSNSISALRVSQWNDASKKGYAGWDPAYNEPLNTTWCYSWDAGINIWDDREYVTHHHHEGWPGIQDVGKNGTSPNILGNNEPDNTGDDREQVNSVAEVLATWPEMMATGRRLGSPAVAGNYAWLYEFMDSIDARGWRCDFVAVHAYWYSDWSSWNSQLSGIRNRTGRPIWITEMNYGANWTGWPGSDRTGSANNYNIQMQHMRPILDGLENTSWVERYAYYNWVEDCRMVIDGNMKLTPIGEYYANIKSDIAYKSTYNVIPKTPKMRDVKDFVVRYDGKTRTATLSWYDYNGEYNTSMTIERQKGSGASWETYATITMHEGPSAYTFEDKDAMNGYMYRVRVIDANGDDRSPKAQEAVLENVKVGDAIMVNGSVKYAGGNVFVNGDFDLGTTGWTNGLGAPLTSAAFSVPSAGGYDGGSYLQAWKTSNTVGTEEALFTAVEVLPNQDYYYSLAFRNPDAASHRLSLSADGKSISTTVALASSAPVWTSQTASFNTAEYSYAIFNAYRLAGKSQLDKILLCPLFDTYEEAVADGLATLRKRAEAVATYLAAHADLSADLTGIVGVITGTDAEALSAMEEAIAQALQAASDRVSLPSLGASVQIAASWEIPGYEELTELYNQAVLATTAVAVVEATDAVRQMLDEMMPMVYAPNYIKEPSFEYQSTNWVVKCGTYTAGDQRINTVAGKKCWNAWWSGISADEGTAKTMEIRQQVSKMEHGLYALECKATTQFGCISDQHAYLIQGTDTLCSEALTYDRMDLPTIADELVWETLVTAPVYVEDGGELTVGFTSSKQGAVDGAWRKYGTPNHVGDKREGWWCATDFTLRYLPMYRVSVPESGWGVICLPRQIIPSSDYKLYQIAGITADYANLCLEEVTETEAGMPYVYYSADTIVTFHERGEAVSKALTQNQLRGNFSTTARTPVKSYYLQNGVWVRVMETAERVSMLDYSGIIRESYGLPVHSEWTGVTLPIPGAAEEWATGIRGVVADGPSTTAEDGIYTIDGRRVSDPGQGNIYIQVENGKSKKQIYK